MSVQRVRSRIAVLGCLLLVLGACGETKKSLPGIFLTVLSPSSGTSIKGNVVALDVAVEGIDIKKADADTSGKTGHFHVFIDREPVAAGRTIPKEAGIVHSAADPITLTGLSVGAHTLKVVLGDGAHNRVGTTVAETKVTIEGPSIDASAPATVPAGGDVTIEVKVEGVQLVAAAKDTGPAGKTGHLHLFIDRDPTAAGQVIPKEAGIIHTTETSVKVPGLAAGEHTIWVVLGDKAHVPFDPRVADSVVVTVG